MKKKIIVRGPALSRSGYGEQTRCALRSLMAHKEEYDIYLLNTSWGQTGWIAEDDEDRRWMDLLLLKTQNYINNKGEFDVSLQVTIPNEWEKMAPINVGYTAGIEATNISPAWIEKSNLMDKIIVVSNHAKSGFDNTAYQVQNSKTGEVMNNYRCTVPIDVVNYPVRKLEKTKLDLDFTTDFNFLVVAQWGPRKNLENTIKWFVEEFIDEPVGLVLKTSFKNHCVMDREHAEKRIKDLLSQYKDRKWKVYLLHGDMSSEEINSLYQHPTIKYMVSLTHGEGYGLPLFEAVYNGLPLIVPAWGGHCDFTYMPEKSKKSKKQKQKEMFLSVEYDILPVQKEAVWKHVLEKEAKWCFAQQGSYKMKLKDAHKNHAFHKKNAKKLQKYVLEAFEEEKLQNQFVKQLDIALTGEEVFVV